MTRLSGDGIYQRVASAMVLSRPFGVVGNAMATLVHALGRYAGVVHRENRTARVSFQFQHTVIAASRSNRRTPSLIRADHVCSVARCAESSSSIVRAAADNQKKSQAEYVPIAGDGVSAA